ncbi:class F sortase [Amycolatopsis sp. A133]|uniref:class F sortase n=1 Tax=Amycolatopsis sp. A133 TaxID=3064472 RepID=UPI0027F0C2DA|nr:class F sortase [Amycolatopsis sp. A133]MDQ7810711.1 class F sortase [Amycolatopsis sp. A133]
MPDADPVKAGAGGRHRNARRLLLALAVVLALAGGGLIWAGVTRTSGPDPVASVGSIPVPATAVTTSDPTATARPVARPPVPLPRSAPVSLRVPSIGVSSPLLSLGLNPDRTVESPKDFGKAGWHDKGPTPGEVGASVILGHIDFYRGPAVFFRLSKLAPGDRIEVLRGDGKTATFTVDAKRQYPKSRFPAKDVYGAVEYAGLRLVTCGGEFDRTARSYLDNIVVYAHLRAVRGRRSGNVRTRPEARIRRRSRRPGGVDPERRARSRVAPQREIHDGADQPMGIPGACPRPVSALMLWPARSCCDQPSRMTLCRRPVTHTWPVRVLAARRGG